MDNTKTVIELFEEQVKKNPLSTAIASDSGNLTYEELNLKAGILSEIIHKKGGGPGKLIGVMVKRSPEMIISILAVLKSGSAYIPIDTAYPKSRIDYILSNSEAVCLLADEQVSMELNLENTEIIDVKDILNNNKGIYCGNTEGLDPKRLMYILYTSGSTGNPKGVMVRCDSFTNMLHWYTGSFGFCDKDSVVLAASVSFDLAQKNIYAPLISGGMLTLPLSGLIDYDDLLAHMDKYKTTILNWTPSAFAPLVTLNDSKNYRGLQNLRYVFLGGESINMSTLEPWIRSVNYRVQIVNTYGPTECTDIASYYCVPQVPKANIDIIPIGKTIPNVEIYILNDKLKQVVNGEKGEICICGKGVSNGYYKDEEKTRSKFVFVPGINKFIYRTGDIGRFLADGNIEFHGRLDTQVKVRGYRIETGEIEAKLQKVMKSGCCTVAAKADKNGEKYLVAYMIRNTQSIEELRNMLASVLPDYMIPTYFMDVEEFPITPNGKLDWKALPDPQNIFNNNTGKGNLKTPTEIEVAEIWRNILGINDIDRDDSFLSIGGNSLKAMVVVANINRKICKKITVRDFFNYQTLKDLSAFLDTLSVNKQAKDTINKEYLNEESTTYELSSVQERMYAMYQLDEQGIGYNLPTAIKIIGNLNCDKLESALNKIINRHEALRTAFKLTENGVRQKIIEVPYQNLEIVELIDFSDDHLEKVTDLFVKPFNLSCPPLFRQKLYLVGENQYVLLLDMHHIIVDGTSIGIIISELEKLYNNESLTPLKIQYKDFAIWHNKQMKSSQMEEHRKYWLQEFQGNLPILNLPQDYKRPMLKTFVGDTFMFRISPEITKKLDTLYSHNNCTLFMKLMSVFGVLLTKHSGQDDIIVGTPIAGRNHADCANVVGMFVNTVAIRMSLAGNKKFSELLLEVREKSLEAFEHQDYQFNMLFDDLKICRDMSRSPLFDTMFVMQNNESILLNKGHITFNEMHVRERISQFDLTLVAHKTEDGLLMKLNYSTALFKESTIAKICSSFAALTEQIVNNPNITLADLSEVEKSNDGVYRRLVNYVNKNTLKIEAQSYEFYANQDTQNPTEIKLLTVWKEVMGNICIGVNGNFFLYGCNSIKAVHLIIKIQEVFGVRLRMPIIFNNPTVRKLATIIDDLLLKSNIPEDFEEIGFAPKERLYKATPRLVHSYYLTKKIGNSKERNMSLCLKSGLKIDRTVAEYAVNSLLKRHSALRTSLLEKGNDIMLCVNDYRYFKLPVIDKSNVIFRERSSEIINQLLDFEFDFSSTSIFRAWLITFCDNINIILIVTHHLISDGMSMDVIKKDFIKAYSQRINNTVCDDEEKILQFHDYSFYINQKFYSGKTNAQEKFWKKKLKEIDIESIRIPADHILSEDSFYAYKTSLLLDKNETSRISKICSDNRITVPTLLAGIANLIIGKWTGMDKALVALQVNGRSSPKLINSFGYYVNSVYWPIKIDTNQTIMEHIVATQIEMNDILENQDFPDRKISELIGKELYPPVFYNFINVTEDDSKIFEVFTPEEEYNGEQSVFDLILESKISEKRIIVDFIYRPSLHNENTIVSLKNKFYKILKCVLQGEIRVITDILLSI